MRTRVLIVEDEAVTALDLKLELISRGYDVCGIANSGEKASQLAESQRPDVILMDIRLANGEDGIDIAQRMRHQHTAALVFLTAHSDDATLRRALDAGPLGYVVKPFQTHDLRTSIEVALARRSQEHQLRQAHKQSSESAQSLQLINSQLLAMTLTDPLTGLGNRRALDAHLEAEWRRLAREQRPLSVAVIDIDHFKAYNDAYGHAQGDRCLREVAHVLDATCQRPGDFACRQGGEEFMMLLPDTSDEQALTLVQEALSRLQSLAIPHAASPVANHVTFSAGIACCIPHPPLLPDRLVDAADRALYEAKHSGRNQVVIRTRDVRQGFFGDSLH